MILVQPGPLNSVLMILNNCEKSILKKSTIYRHTCVSEHVCVCIHIQTYLNYLESRYMCIFKIFMKKHREYIYIFLNIYCILHPPYLSFDSMESQRSWANGNKICCIINKVYIGGYDIDGCSRPNEGDKDKQIRLQIAAYFWYVWKIWLGWNKNWIRHLYPPGNFPGLQHCNGRSEGAQVLCWWEDLICIILYRF